MKLKEIRSRNGLTQKQLADQMKTTQQTVARWETGKTILNVEQVQDLCVVLDCAAEELLGWEAGSSAPRESPFATVGREVPYGTLQINLTCGDREYPISDKARKSLLTQTEAFGPINSGDNTAWLESWTLNNKLLLINPKYFRRFRLVSDDVEEMPSFENPEIYRALEGWPEITASGITRQKCNEFAASLGGDEAVSRLISSARITYDDGSEEWCTLDDQTATEWFSMVMMWDNLGQHCIAQIDEEGPHVAVFANLGRVALIEIPTELYLRLTSPEDGV